MSPCSQVVQAWWVVSACFNMAIMTYSQHGGYEQCATHQDAADPQAWHNTPCCMHQAVAAALMMRSAASRLTSPLPGPDQKSVPA